jgi:hypothetical protein
MDVYQEEFRRSRSARILKTPNYKSEIYNGSKTQLGQLETAGSNEEIGFGLKLPLGLGRKKSKVRPDSDLANPVSQI